MFNTVCNNRWMDSDESDEISLLKQSFYFMYFLHNNEI